MHLDEVRRESLKGETPSTMEEYLALCEDPESALCGLSILSRDRREKRKVSAPRAHLRLVPPALDRISPRAKE